MIKKFFLNNIYMYFFFLENNSIYVSGISNNKKIKRKLQILFLYNCSNLVKILNLFRFNLYKNRYYFSYYNILESRERSLFNGTFYGFKSKIKIVGRGWKIIKTTYNTLLIKLGYSHPLFLTLSFYIKYKIKKKKKNIMFFMVHFLIK